MLRNIKEWFCDRRFDREAFITFLMTTGIVAIVTGGLFLFVWSCQNHPEIIFIIFLSGVLLFLIYNIFNVLFPKTKRILFLDIDGVLNCHSTHTYYDPDYANNYSIDPACWLNLEKILNKFPYMKVVIHSGWVKTIDDPNYEWDMGFPERGIKVKSLIYEVIKRLGNRYIGHVKYLKGRSKHDRIQEWLSSHLQEFETNKIVVVDDDQGTFSRIKDLESYPYIKVFFTDPNVGLDELTADAIISALK